MKIQKIIIGVATVILVMLGVLYAMRSTPITNYPSRGTDVVAFGDSLVAGVGSSQGNDFVSLVSNNLHQPIANLGHPGDTTADGIARLSELDAYKPKVVLLLFGGNDHLQKISITETRRNLATLIENIQSRGAIVLLLGVRGGLLSDNFNSMFKELRDTYHTAYVSDVLGGLFGDDRYMSDPVHPNDVGYKIIAERVSVVLEKLLK